jgi:hypothetical protein
MNFNRASKGVGMGYIRVRFDWTKARPLIPLKHLINLFELYSVPSFEEQKPDIIAGAKIGSNKQAVDKETVLLCKINPRINRVWIVGNFSKYGKRLLLPNGYHFFNISGISPKYLQYFLMNKDFRSFLSLNVSGVGGSLMRVKARALWLNILFLLHQFKNSIASLPRLRSFSPTWMPG